MILPLTALLLSGPAFSRQIRVDGEGFFRVARAGQAVYASELSVREVDGRLLTSDGFPLLPKVTGLEPGKPFEIGIDGTITSAGKIAGRLVLAMFPEGTKLHREGSYLICTQRSVPGSPGDGMFGVIRSTAESSKGSTSKTPAKPIQKTGRPLIQVAATSEVEGEQILLGDIADISVEPALLAKYKAVELGTPPVFGARRGISEMYILAKMRNQGLNPDNVTILCPPGATVFRKGQTVIGDTLLEAAIEAAKAAGNPDVPMRSQSKIYDLKLPMGELQILPGQVSKTDETITVNLSIAVDGSIPVYRSITLVPSNATVKLKVGDPILLRIIRGSATVEVSAKVKTGGALGTAITVQTETGALFSALYKAPGLAEVKI